jgi:hypothetical protein
MKLYQWMKVWRETAHFGLFTQRTTEQAARQK